MKEKKIEEKKKFIKIDKDMFSAFLGIASFVGGIPLFFKIKDYVLNYLTLGETIGLITFVIICALIGYAIGGKIFNKIVG